MGGPCDYSVTPSPNWTFGFLTDLVLGLGLGGLDLGLGLDNKITYALRRRAGFGRRDIIRTQNPDSIHNHGWILFHKLLIKR